QARKPSSWAFALIRSAFSRGVSMGGKVGCVVAVTLPGMRQVHITRYIMPLREGGSLPGLVDADDGFKYVVKFRGNGHGPKALIAELIGGEVARALGLRVPELVFAD